MTKQPTIKDGLWLVCYEGVGTDGRMLQGSLALVLASTTMNNLVNLISGEIELSKKSFVIKNMVYLS